MRAGGGCTGTQHALTVEAGAIIKQAVNLAKRRGHAQVTPLHVANTMLNSSPDLLRKACSQSLSHPLQCKALELCFNVALNRLPAASPSPVFGTHSQHPSISNALVAAFKRAQAHQRRGSIENQQQPLLAVKIELGQLIISILDDPSVSRVMKEAGFSSAQVKSNVERHVSLETCTKEPQAASNNGSKASNVLIVASHQNPTSLLGETGLLSGTTNTLGPIRDEDVTYVLENLANKRRRSTVIVGECLASVESVVRGVMDKLTKGDNGVPHKLRGVKFLNLYMNSFEHMNREEVDGRVRDLKSHVKDHTSNSDHDGVILFLGDLKWTAEHRAKSRGQSERSIATSYCPVEHLVMEIGGLISEAGENGRLWLMGVSTFHSYMSCKRGYPSLETLWFLHPLTIPAGTLSLSLITDREPETTHCTGDQKAGNGESTSMASAWSGSSTISSSSLPPWLQHYKDENRRHGFHSDEEYACRRWDSEKIPIIFSSLPPSPSPSTSCFSHDRQSPDTSSHHVIINHDRSLAKQSFRDNKFWITPETMQIDAVELSSHSNSASSSEIVEIVEYTPRFKELSSENLKTLCAELEKNLPWQKDIIADIATVILRCRSGMLCRKLGSNGENIASFKNEAWLLFEGMDSEAKEKMARELARLVFGSCTRFISMSTSSFSSSSTPTRTCSSDHNRINKRSRQDTTSFRHGYFVRFVKELSSNPHRVFFLENIEQADHFSKMGFKKAIERGRITSDLTGNNEVEVELSDAIIILSCESCPGARSTACSPDFTHEARSCLSLDLNALVDEGDSDNDRSANDVGLLDCVDGRVSFKVKAL